MAYNVRAAWRSGGLHCRSCGLQTFNFALPFLRGYCRRCAKPPVVCSCIFRECCLCRFHYIFGPYFLFGLVSFSAILSDCTFSGRLSFPLHSRVVLSVQVRLLFYFIINQSLSLSGSKSLYLNSIIVTFTPSTLLLCVRFVGYPSLSKT